MHLSGVVAAVQRRGGRLRSSLTRPSHLREGADWVPSQEHTCDTSDTSDSWHALDLGV
jgi:hypothetical protein